MAVVSREAPAAEDHNLQHEEVPTIVITFTPDVKVVMANMSGVSVSKLEIAMTAMHREFQVYRAKAVHDAGDELRRITQRNG